MSVVNEMKVRATPAEVLGTVDARLGRTEDVFSELRRTGEYSVGVAVYEQYFARVKNRIALMVVADDFDGQGETLVRVIVTGSSQGLIFNIDWGAAGSYAAEAMSIISALNGKE